MASLALTAVGADRPGIVARVTAVLLEHGGNIEDSSMTILGGQFAMLLLVDCASAPADLERDLVAATLDLGLVVAVRELGRGTRSATPTHVLSVYGSDRPGLVHGVAEVLAEHEVNVTDLETRLLPGPVYAMVFEVALPAGVEADALADDVRRRSDDLEVSVHALDAATF